MTLATVFFLDRRSLWVLLGSLLALSIPEAPAVQGRWPSPSQSSLTSGWEAAGGWEGAWRFGQELAPGWVIAFNIGEMGASLVKEAGCKGL